MKRYKIKYKGQIGGSLEGLFDESTYDDTFNLIPNQKKINVNYNLDLRPIINNSFFNIKTNTYFRDLYLDFDNYYHHLNFNIETRETVEKFLKNPQAIDSALKLISYWVIHLWDSNKIDIQNELEQNISLIGNNDADSAIIDDKDIHNYEFLYDKKNLNDYPNIINYFSESSKYGGIGDYLLGQENLHFFSYGPIFKENSEILKISGITKGVFNAKTFMSLINLSPTELLKSAVLKTIDYGKDYILNILNKRYYYINNEEDLFIYLKHTFFKKYVTEKDEANFKKVTYIHNFSEKIQDYTNIIKNFFKKSDDNILQIADSNNNEKYHVTYKSIQMLKLRLNTISKQINEYEKENKELLQVLTINPDKYQIKLDLDEIYEKKKKLSNEKHNIEEYIKKYEEDSFNEEDIINASYILRQACYIIKIRMLIYINYNENHKENEELKNIINTQINLTKIKQNIFSNLIKDKIIPVIYNIKKDIENFED